MVPAHQLVGGKIDTKLNIEPADNYQQLSTRSKLQIYVLKKKKKNKRR